MGDTPTLSELRHRIWDESGIRVSHSASREQLEAFIQYKKDVPESPVNGLRDKIISFIKQNRNRLSLSCDGDCYQHHDGVVLFCHSQLIEEPNGSNKKEKDA